MLQTKTDQYMPRTVGNRRIHIVDRVLERGRKVPPCKLACCVASADTYALTGVHARQVIDRLLERGKVRAMRQALAARRRSSLEQPQQAGSTTSRSEVTMSDSGAELASASGSGLEQGSGGSSRGQLSRSHSGACDWDQKPELDNADVSGLATFHEAVWPRCAAHCCERTILLLGASGGHLIWRWWGCRLGVGAV